MRNRHIKVDWVPENLSDDIPSLFGMLCVETRRLYIHYLTELGAWNDDLRIPDAQKRVVETMGRINPETFPTSVDLPNFAELRYRYQLDSGNTTLIRQMLKSDILELFLVLKSLSIGK